MALDIDTATCVLAITDGGDVIAYAAEESNESAVLLRASAEQTARDQHVGVSIVRVELPLPIDGRSATVTQMARVEGQ